VMTMFEPQQATKKREHLDAMEEVLREEQVMIDRLDQTYRSSWRRPMKLTPRPMVMSAPTQSYRRNSTAIQESFPS
jgi:hypothetical protein